MTRKPILWVAIFCLLIQGCSINQDSYANEEDVPFDIEIQNQTVDSDNCKITIPIVQLCGMADGTLEKQINRVLQKSLSWINGNCVWISDCIVHAFLKNELYLSVKYEIAMYNDEYPVDGQTIRIYTTVNLKTGEQVRLNDFFPTGESLLCAIDEDAIDRDVSPSLSLDQAKELIIYASMTEEEFLAEMSKEDFYTYEKMALYLLGKPGFYLDGNTLVIKRNKYIRDDIYIDLRGTVPLSGPS